MSWVKGFESFEEQDVLINCTIMIIEEKLKFYEI